MVSPVDLKGYKSAGGGLGGTINTSDLIVTASHNNLFTNTPAVEALAGEDYYRSMFFKNEHGSEDMNEFIFWETADSPNPDTEYKWAFDPAWVRGYKYSPFFTGTGTEFDSTASTAALQATTFALAAWFRTTSSGLEMMIVNKGGDGSEAAGQNDNYSLRQTVANKIRFGFEEGSGVDHYIDSPLSYNDGDWHFACGDYDAATLDLYVDDMVTPVSSVALSATPESSGTNPVVIGRNSRDSTLFWIGNIDEVRVFNATISESHRIQLFDKNIANPSSLVLEKKFGADDGTIVGQTIPNQLTPPVNVTWQAAGPKPTTPNVGKLGFGKTFMIWVWKHVNAGAKPARDDPDLFAFTFKIPQGGTGTPGSGGGGSGGNPPPAVTNYKIAFAGDWGCEPETDDVISLINAQGYDFVWGVGDNAYASASCWTNRFSPLKNAGKLDSAYGNHEYSESGGTQPYKTFFGHSITYFTRQVQNILFLVIDTNINCDPGSAQHTAIKNALEASATNASIVWKIGLFHHPMFGASSSHPYNSADTVQAFMDLFITHKVSIVVTGHNHNFQRSKLVARNDSNPTSPTVVQDAAPYSRNAGGLVHVISGGGGHDSGSSLYSLGSQPAFQAYQSRSHNGVWEIIASNSGNTLTCQFRNTSGEVFDTFVFNS